jgi:hypothetical protein
MAFDLIAEFHGLMCLVPALDGKSADVVSLNGQASGVGTHVTRLAVDAAAIAYESGDAEPSGHLGLPGGTRMAFWNLSHTEVSFSRTSSPDLDIKDDFSEFVDPPNAPSDVTEPRLWQPARWLGCASMAASADGKSHRYVDPDFLNTHTDSSGTCNNPTDALVRLAKGVVAAGRPYSTILRTKVCAFSDEDDFSVSHTRALSDHFTATANYELIAVIGLKLFGGNTRYVHLQPPDGGSQLRVAFSALPAPGHVHAAVPSTEAVGKIGHFRAYYSLLKDPVHKRIPHVKEAAISSTECPPALARRG